eukprot:TRINITY_DN55610_c0_g1_i1.p1 TRINITY_DN55610_c0_g1~~TRINITY_DN55610_c0_g1_i1.p1  ORF type:complete len:116 (+),score=26.57 TRINITY_DN55610_c0_g1_i1:75-422(+)
MLRSLVGSEMCIRDSPTTQVTPVQGALAKRSTKPILTPTYTIREFGARRCQRVGGHTRGGDAAAGVLAGVAVGVGGDEVDICLLYTSDAADEEDRVVIGGRRVLYKKKKVCISRM